MSKSEMVRRLRQLAAWYREGEWCYGENRGPLYSTRDFLRAIREVVAAYKS